MEGQNKIAGLILKQLRGDELDEHGKAELDAWINESRENELLYQQLTNPDLLQQEVVDFYEANLTISQKIKKSISAPKLIPLWKKLSAAAAIFILLGTSSYFILIHPPAKAPMAVKPKGNDIKAPETARAVITLTDGSKVYLDSVSSGVLAQQGNVNLVKNSNGEINYQLTGKNSQSVVYNTLTNPRGSNVATMALSDGTKVWLNAGSSITYPVAFTGTERKISITGEAYFEVAHDPSRPFMVRKGEVSVRVLGTHFNINAFEDEEDIKITLLEGSVKVNKASSSTIIKPGEQAKVGGAISIIDDVDLEQVMAWKNGLFNLNGENIKTIMRQISRWYDADIEYNGDVTGIDFYGTVSRRQNVSELLRVMEKTGIVHFKIEGRKIIVSK